MKIAIQGILGSYHHQAATEYFGTENLELNQLRNFSNLAKSIFTGESEYGIMAIENSIAGTLLPNYGLISKYNLKIVGEIYLPIHHQLMTSPETTWDEVEEIRSHPMALLQCDNFLGEFERFKVVETVDTASAAKEIAEKKLKNTAAIASKLSAEIYGLKIIRQEIQNIYKNSTRFFVLNRDLERASGFNKVSLKFSTSHEKGALANVLNEISSLDLNMKKIQSVPIVDEPWRYAFHVDLELNHPEQLGVLLDRIRPKTSTLSVLGCYKNANDPILNPNSYSAELEIIG